MNIAGQWGKAADALGQLLQWMMHVSITHHKDGLLQSELLHAAFDNACAKSDDARLTTVMV